jgi:hypothetical protein
MTTVLKPREKRSWFEMLYIIQVDMHVTREATKFKQLCIYITLDACLTCSRHVGGGTCAMPVHQSQEIYVMDC